MMWVSVGCDLHTGRVKSIHGWQWQWQRVLDGNAQGLNIAQCASLKHN